MACGTARACAKPSSTSSSDSYDTRTYKRDHESGTLTTLLPIIPARTKTDDSTLFLIVFILLTFFVDCLRGTLVSGNASVLVSSETATPKLSNDKQHACDASNEQKGRCGIHRLVERFARELVESDGQLDGGVRCRKWTCMHRASAVANQEVHLVPFKAARNQL